MQDAKRRPSGAYQERGNKYESLNKLILYPRARSLSSYRYFNHRDDPNELADQLPSLSRLF